MASDRDAAVRPTSHMTPSPTAAHPEHALEQAYIERAHDVELQLRARAERQAEGAPDKHTARSMRQQMLERFSEPLDLEALCFGRIDLENGRTHYVGRGAVRDDEKLLV